MKFREIMKNFQCAFNVVVILLAVVLVWEKQYLLSLECWILSILIDIHLALIELNERMEKYERWW